MMNTNRPPSEADPHDLDRFVRAQDQHYEQALAEIRCGCKRSHWMWFIFPQFDGLGFSSTSKHFAIKSMEEAKAYLKHPVLGARLVECMEALIGVQERSAEVIFGTPDDRKLRSCATLFAIASSPDSIFVRVLGKYFHGILDEATLKLLGE